MLQPQYRVPSCLTTSECTDLLASGCMGTEWRCVQVRTVTAAAAASREPPKRPRVIKPDTRDGDGHSSPVHWFVADDTVTKIRHFSLQVCHRVPTCLCSGLPTNCGGWAVCE